MRPLVRSTFSVPCLRYIVVDSSESSIFECDSSSELSFDIGGRQTPVKPPHTGLEYVRHMDEVGWRLGGVFLHLLSSVGSSFYQERGRVRISRDADETSEALAVLISEL